MRNGGSIRKGIVSNIHPEERMIDVYFEDEDYTQKNILLIDQLNVPVIDSSVTCIFTIDNEGICLNGSYQKASSESYTIYKRLGPQTIMGIDEATGDVLIIAPSVKVIGNLIVEGNIQASGNITAEGGVL